MTYHSTDVQYVAHSLSLKHEHAKRILEHDSYPAIDLYSFVDSPYRGVSRINTRIGEFNIVTYNP